MLNFQWKNSLERSWADLAIAFLTENEYESATSSISRWKKNFPDSQYPVFFDAIVEYARGNIDDAISKVEKFLQYDQDNVTGLIFYYYLNLKSENMKQAQEIFTRVLKKSYRPENVYQILGDILLRSMDLKGAIKFYRKSLVFAPENARLWAAMGLAFTKLHRYEDAEIALQRAEKLAKTEDELAQAAVYFLLSGKHKKALEIYAASETTEIDNTLFWINKGLAHYLNHDTQQAKDCWEQILQINPDHPYAHYNLGCFYINNNDFDTGWEHIEKALKFSPFFIKRAKIDHDVKTLLAKPEFAEKLEKITTE